MTYYKITDKGIMVSFDAGETWIAATSVSLTSLILKMNEVLINRRNPITPDWIINE